MAVTSEWIPQITIVTYGYRSYREELIPLWSHIFPEGKISIVPIKGDSLSSPGPVTLGHSARDWVECV